MRSEPPARSIGRLPPVSRGERQGRGRGGVKKHIDCVLLWLCLFYLSEDHRSCQSTGGRERPPREGRTNTDEGEERKQKALVGNERDPSPWETVHEHTARAFTLPVFSFCANKCDTGRRERERHNPHVSNCGSPESIQPPSTAVKLRSDSLWA